MSKVLKAKKIGLALGGGGAKGLAHIGVIKVLKNAGIPVDFIAGTSMGALVGAWYALTEDADFLESLFLKLKRGDIFPFREILKKRDGALFRGDAAEKLLKENFRDRRFENCKIPFAAVATDFKNGEEVIVKRGRLIDGVRASIALPIIFRPAEVGGRLLIDGGFCDPVPADIVREMGADYVIAVDVSSRWLNVPEKSVGMGSIYSVFMNSLSVAEYHLAEGVLKRADLVLRPPVWNYDLMDFNSSSEIIRAGGEEMRLHLKEVFRKTGYKESPKTVVEKFIDFLFHE